ncbi:uncharacterized protein LOC113751354 isoform X2 [Coffea eugenioides]|uniref:Uncharacterized protein isoform X2 n=1 Tax=Coffea arabica TaxID=13443 RepID=A0A6P6WFS7_COFAR|nr:uncharacterized protein LOC113732572 isoform X2 [Coffea arabica]XP_027151135.1 uncharacterized protein LOC113751354 isoform X2 [Coffea eugenioides]
MSPAASRIATFGLSSSCCCTRSTVLHPPILHNQAAIPIAFSPQVLYLRRQNGKKMLILPNYRNHHHPLRPCSVNDNQDSQTKESSDISLPEQTDSTGKENHQQESLTTNEILKRLKRYGVAGVLSYGLLNTCYYLSTFLFVWLYVAPAPGRMGYVAAAERFLKILAMVWAGSQVTKLIRAGWALALAPAVDRGLSWFTIKYKFKSQGKASMAIAGFCFGLAFMVFLVLTLLWA